MSQPSIQEVLKRHTRDLMRIEGVAGTGQGQWEGKPCITVFVTRRTEQVEQQVPDELEGYPVRIEVTGGFEAQPGTP